MQASTLRSHATLWIGAALVAVMLFGFAIWYSSNSTQAVAAEATLLFTQLDPDDEVTVEEYGVWKQIAAADMRVRLAAAQLPQDTKYAPLLFSSAELLGRTLVGADYDGTMSRELAEELVCRPLQSAPATAARAVPLYLVPWLNPAALDSALCAAVLTDRVVKADPGTFLQGAQLLALVLASLPAEQAAPYVDTLVNQVGVAHPAAVDVLFSALRRVDSARFPAEFTRAVQTLATRITAAESASAIMNLFDAVDFLKYSVTPDQLTPVLDAAIARMLERSDTNLTHELYFTLADLKISHPDTSFGARADYLMRGINIYSDALEIYDYSGVLRRDDQYAASPGQEAALAAALLVDIRNLGEEDYLSSIWPYCKRFLEIAPALGYAEFLDGARVLFDQARNETFLFQRPCLLDSPLVARIAADDRPEFAASVVGALTELGQTGSARTATRVAENVELLGLLGTELDAEQLAQVTALVSIALASEDEAYPLAVVMRAVAAANVNFPPEFYPELFVLLSSSTADPAPLAALSAVLQKLPDAQRAYVVDTSVSNFLAPQSDAVAFAAQAELMAAMKPWLPDDSLQQTIAVLVAAIENPQDIAVLPRLTRALVVLGRQATAQVNAAQEALVRHLANSEQRAELAALFQAAGALGMASTFDDARRETLRSATVRFLEQITPQDALAGAVRGILTAPPAEAEPEPKPASATYMTRAQRQAPSRATLEPADVDKLASRYIHALANERVSHPIADYALSIAILAQYARPGELATLLDALRERLDSSTDATSHGILVSTWISVEASTNKTLTPEQRIPLYLDVLHLPLTSADSRKVLVDAAGTIANQEFAGDPWELVKWALDAGLLDSARQN